jgi:filamentous hemagglutinin family protein
MPKKWLSLLSNTLAPFFVPFSILIYPSTSVLAQSITLDGSVGTPTPLNGPNYQIPQSAGQTVGNNLFHSFGKFNLNSNEAAIFESAGNIKNILSRVTGGNASSIDGLIRTLGSDVNFFLINPNGIIFGQNARLNVSGSFLASTANAIQFGNQGFFSATNPESPSPLLTVNPSALFFNQVQAARIESKLIAPFEQNSPGLQVPEGRSLSLIGGDISLDGGSLNAFGGRVELAAVADNGIVGLNVDDGNNLILSVPENIKKGNISINNGVIDVRTANNGGDIVINAKDFQLSGVESLLWAGIRQDMGVVNGQAGDVNITAESVVLSDSSVIFNSVRPNAVGNGGDIKIKTDSLSLTGGAELVANTIGQGNVGNIIVEVRNGAIFDGIDSEGFPSAIFNVVRSEGIGNSGYISLTAGSVSLTNGARLQNNTRGQGNAGNIIIQVGDRLFLDGANTKIDETSSGIYTTVGTDGKGNGGDISITAGSLDVLNGANITATTFQEGSAGNIKIEVRKNAQFNGFNIKGGSGAFTAVAPVAVGNGGDIQLTAGLLTLSNGGVLSAVSGGTGNAGSIKIVTDFLTLDNGVVVTETNNTNGGNINLNLQDLLFLRHNSKISTTAGNQQFDGDAGNITINTPFIVAIPQENSDITANAFTNRGGQVKINATGIFGINPLSRNQLITLLGTDEANQLNPEKLPSNDITAISQQSPNLSGQITINTPNTDPTRGLIQLPSNLVDASQQIAQECTPKGKTASRFIATGRGGLPLTPNEPLRLRSVITNWVALNPDENPQPRKIKAENPPQTVEAQGWIINPNGEVQLVGQLPFNRQDAKCAKEEGKKRNSP